MGSSDISSIGKVFAQSMAQGSTGSTEKDIKAAFGEVMSQMTAMAGNGLAADNRLMEKNAAQLTEKTADTDQSYDRYQYRDRSIQQGKAVDDTVGEAVTERLDTFADDVKEVLKEELGVTEEQIAEAMEALGISFAELMNPKQLAALVAELTGAKDMSVLLCDSDFLTVMQEVGAFTRELLSELGISAEELQEMLQNGAMNAEEDSMTAVQEDDMTAAAEDGMTEAQEERAAQDSEMKVTEPDIRGEQQTAEEAEAPAETKNAAQEVAEAEDASSDVDVMQKDEEIQQLSSGREGAASGKGAFENQHPQNENGGNIAMHPDIAEHTSTQPQPQTGTNAFTSQLDVTNIIRQITEFTRVTVENRVTTMEMQLNPENLGKLYLELSSKDGVVSAHITAQNEAVKEMLESQLVEVRQNMNQAGVKVDAVEVTVGSHEFERNLEQNTRQNERQAEAQEKAVNQTRRLRLDDLDELGGLMTEEETLVAQMMAEQGNSIDFTA